MGGWGKVRAPTMARLAEAMETRPKVTGKAYAAIISRSRPAGGLGCEDKRAVAEWADACGMGCVPLKDFEAAVVSNAAIAEEMFGGDAANAKKGVRLLVESGVVDRARQGRRGRASVYVTYPTRADVEEGSYAPPDAENAGYACVPPNTVENPVENENRGYAKPEYGVRGYMLTWGFENTIRVLQRIHQRGREARLRASPRPAPRTARRAPSAAPWSSRSPATRGWPSAAAAGRR